MLTELATGSAIPAVDDRAVPAGSQVDDLSDGGCVLVAGDDQRARGDPVRVVGLVEEVPGVAAVVFIVEVSADVHAIHSRPPLTTRRSVAAFVGTCSVDPSVVRVLAISLRQTACTVRPSMPVKSFGLRVYTDTPCAIAVAAISAS
jgi:hypothetical protein